MSESSQLNCAEHSRHQFHKNALLDAVAFEGCLKSSGVAVDTSRFSRLSQSQRIETYTKFCGKQNIE